MRTCLQCGEQTDSLHCPADGMATVVQGVTPASAALLEGTLFAGRYRISGVLGRGGMGAVYEAQHTGTGQSVAIKTLLLDNAGDVSAVRRFFHEARMTAALQHPNTVRVFDFGQSDEGVFYLAMERLRGETLGDMQARLDAKVRPMTQEEAGRIAMDVLRSLAEAHKAGLVHRDLKPANIFLHDMGTGEHVVKVLDFGIAKSNDTHLTKTGTSIGTPSYMSPEQVMSGQVDGRSDLYALGVILYGCVVGMLPFQADSSYSMMMKHVAEPAPDLNALHLPGITPAFAAVVQKALEKKPEDRFADAQSMREALEQALRPVPTTSPVAPAQPKVPAPPKVAPTKVAPPKPVVRPPDPMEAAPKRSGSMALVIVGVVAAVTAMAGVGIWWTLKHRVEEATAIAAKANAAIATAAVAEVPVAAVAAPPVVIAPPDAAASASPDTFIAPPPLPASDAEAQAADVVEPAAAMPEHPADPSVKNEVQTGEHQEAVGGIPAKAGGLLKIFAAPDEAAPAAPSNSEPPKLHPHPHPPAPPHGLRAPVNTRAPGSMRAPSNMRAPSR